MAHINSSLQTPMNRRGFSFVEKKSLTFYDVRVQMTGKFWSLCSDDGRYPKHIRFICTHKWGPKWNREYLSFKRIAKEVCMFTTDVCRTCKTSELGHLHIRARESDSSFQHCVFSFVVVGWNLSFTFGSRIVSLIESFKCRTCNGVFCHSVLECKVWARLHTLLGSLICVITTPSFTHQVST